MELLISDQAEVLLIIQFSACKQQKSAPEGEKYIAECKGLEWRLKLKK